MFAEGENWFPVLRGLRFDAKRNLIWAVDNYRQALVAFHPHGWGAHSVQCDFARYRDLPFAVFQTADEIVTARDGTIEVSQRLESFD